ncbi:Mut7-C RNAse domain-containing protein [Methylocaldum sp.]|uniref:Mut7-C RNAse domain-containing protein n=1 Tax=Methylocaldum sp. TaxID=1969727 RepID=UPI002D55ED05|nr:Mut7-C RNAse domain-containing protein [Methylocaldum sp.]HYE34448.1 Mut7-C RNAse domain-containing protein [Methylocaldum sp.]
MAHQAEFRFYEELNDFLPPGRRKQTFPYPFQGTPSVKDAIEALGVPHTEVELILVNGDSVGFDYRLKPGDRVAVYPLFESFDISPLVRLREKPLREVRFVIDVNLGKLARLLRLAGFDALYRNDFTDRAICRIAAKDHRTVLTRDRGLLCNKLITRGYFVRSAAPGEQFAEVIRRFDLSGQLAPFTRCSLCNGKVQPVPKETVLDRLEPETRRYYDEFFLCTGCGKIYWPGSHVERMRERLNRLLA